MIVKQKENCTVTIMRYSELGLNSQPFLKKTSTDIKFIPEEIDVLMTAHGMTYAEAKKAHEENLQWAM